MYILVEFSGHGQINITRGVEDKSSLGLRPSLEDLKFVLSFDNLVDIMRRIN
jgi:hypothetical protein